MTNFHDKYVIIIEQYNEKIIAKSKITQFPFLNQEDVQNLSGERQYHA